MISSLCGIGKDVGEEIVHCMLVQVFLVPVSLLPPIFLLLLHPRISKVCISLHPQTSVNRRKGRKVVKTQAKTWGNPRESVVAVLWVIPGLAHAQGLLRIMLGKLQAICVSLWYPLPSNCTFVPLDPGVQWPCIPVRR